MARMGDVNHIFICVDKMENAVLLLLLLLVVAKCPADQLYSDVIISATTSKLTVVTKKQEIPNKGNCFLRVGKFYKMTSEGPLSITNKMIIQALFALIIC